jgi:N-acetylglucosaminyldiphosphoundecaprenol N-acetyl-beta-D-mannosaminyltransferase
MQGENTSYKKKRVGFFGAQIDPLTMQETLDSAQEIIHQGKPRQHVVVNVAKLVTMQKNEEIRNIVNSCSLINADGQGIVWGANLFGANIPERVAGIDLFTNLVKLANEKGFKLYFLGAREEVVNKVIDTFKTNYPGIKIVGKRNGYFKENEEKEIAEEIRKSKADILFVAMGSPQKEIFLNKHLNNMEIPFVMGVGGSFDVVAGVTKRAPMWMQKAGMEWFYRFMCEPKRMWKRYLLTNSIFLGMIIKALISRKKGLALS